VLLALLVRHAWLVPVVTILLSVSLQWRKVQPQIATRPELKDGYRRLVRRVAVWLTLPWLVMGLGCIAGAVPGVVHYLFPVWGGPFVWLFWAVVYGELLLLAYWGVFGRGAELLVRHPGVVNIHAASVPRMKWLLGCLAAAGLLSSTGLLLALSRLLV
jgi:hypothetical protein